MRQSILLTAVLGTLSIAQVSYAAEAEEKAPAAVEAKSAWAATANIGMVSDYYARGISQNWHKPAVQGGIDITHDSGFYIGTWGSNVTPNTFPDATAEIDVYGGYNGTISAVEGLGWSAGLISYLYPGGSWKKYRYLDDRDLTPKGGRWNTTEVNFGLSYSYFSAKLSYTLTDWFGADKDSGWDGGTKGTTYFELNAAYPLPWWDLTLIGHVGRLNVAGRLDLDYLSPSGVAASTSGTNATNPDYTDYKIGLSKPFKIGVSEGWTAGLYYVGASNRRYWGDTGYGGASFNGSTEAKNLNDGRAVFTLTRTF
ncbi:MAG TPA: TorF family putative porin [Methylophilus sp.]|nr:TorF family putative porin [Methylophilus sp.]